MATFDKSKLIKGELIMEIQSQLTCFQLEQVVTLNAQ